MMIVMKAAATEEEIQSVIDRIEERRRARPSVARRRGHRDRRDRRPRARAAARARGRPRRRAGRADPQALQARLGADPPDEPSVIEIEGRQIGGEHFSMIAGPCTVETRDQTIGTAHTVKAAGGSLFRGGAYKPRTSPYALPGARSGGPAAARRGQGRDRPADRHRVHGRARPRAGARGGRRDPDRRPQHAELPAAGRDRPLGAPGAAQARRVGDARGAADGGGVHPQGGQPERAAVRARHPHVRDRLPLHARPHRRARCSRSSRTCP